MGDNSYTYAVARIRAKELSLFSASTLEQLIACQDYASCISFLQDKGWGDNDSAQDAEAILNCERDKTWKLIRELVDDMSIFDVMTYPNLFHNLKAAIKQVGTGKENSRIFYQDTAVSGEEMVRIVSEKDWYALPKNMQAAAEEATEAFLHTKDGQMCDIIVDKAALDAVYEAGKAARDDILRQYAETTVAVADIKIAVRSQKTAKSLEFMRRALAPCDSLNAERLAQAAVSGMEAIISFLEGTDYAGGAEALKESASAFERWCDNRMMETIRPQKYNAFSIGPIVAYVLARENEIKTVRIILSGKLNGLSDASIRERVREMYV
jgi:V/A-type H+-transporting ATPase subunit C